MRQLLRVSVIALSLLTSAATAYAECAWVVWRQTLSDSPAVPKSGNWIPEAAFRTKEECVRDVEQKRAAYFGEAKLEGYVYTRGAYCRHCRPARVEGEVKPARAEGEVKHAARG
jgi:hypothetical protein